jgi:hypothetical protein
MKYPIMSIEEDNNGKRGVEREGERDLESASVRGQGC